MKKSCLIQVGLSLTFVCYICSGCLKTGKGKDKGKGKEEKVESNGEDHKKDEPKKKEWFIVCFM